MAKINVLLLRDFSVKMGEKDDPYSCSAAVEAIIPHDIGAARLWPPYVYIMDCLEADFILSQKG